MKIKKTLVLAGHPDLNNESIANKIILNRLSKERYIEVRDLYSLYPDFKINIEAEQQTLIEADTIVFQFPFYWYSIPGMLKEWLDKVFTYGFAYGSTGTKLHGKNFIISTTIGGPEESYNNQGYNNYTIEQLLYPLRQTANLAGMKFISPIISHSMVYIPGVYNVQEEVESRAHKHFSALISKIQTLSKIA